MVAACLTKGADLNRNCEDLAMLASHVRDIAALMERLVDFANLQRVGSYVNAVSILKKSAADLGRLRELWLSIGYLGLETGDPVVNELVRDGVRKLGGGSPAEMAKRFAPCPPMLVGDSGRTIAPQ